MPACTKGQVDEEHKAFMLESEIGPQDIQADEWYSSMNGGATGSKKGEGCSTRPRKFRMR
jgi:hypothetical protein